MTTNQLHFGRDEQGYNAYAPLDASIKYSATLADGTASSITVPKTFPVWIAAFGLEPGANVWVSFSGTAAIPVGGTFASTASSLNPGQRMVNGGTTISAITDNTTADVCIELWPCSYP